MAAALILYPLWYDPYRDRLCEVEDVLSTLEARARAWREDHHGWVATGIRLWKRGAFQRVFGRQKRMRFAEPPEKAMALAQRLGRPVMGWASALPPEAQGIARVEDGFLRSRGLGAELVPPMSLVLDPDGIYYDPTRPSGLESLIHTRRNLRPDQALRARALQRALTQGRLSKYNLGGAQPDLPDGHRVLVVGQVEDDASIRQGAGDVATNLGLLSAARAARPDAVILYKPHPDVEAGLRRGAVPDAEQIADQVLTRTDPIALLDAVQEVWTMTSLLGFEALLRGVPVTTLGAPFYAGWGLTQDLGRVPARRGGGTDLLALIHATLIDYPRYHDPVTGQPCPVEMIVDRLQSDTLPKLGHGYRVLSKLQGLFASQSWIWR